MNKCLQNGMFQVGPGNTTPRHSDAVHDTRSSAGSPIFVAAKLYKLGLHAVFFPSFVHVRDKRRRKAELASAHQTDFINGNLSSLFDISARLNS